MYLCCDVTDVWLRAHAVRKQPAADGEGEQPVVAPAGAGQMGAAAREGRAAGERVRRGHLVPAAHRVARAPRAPAAPRAARGLLQAAQTRASAHRTLSSEHTHSEHTHYLPVVEHSLCNNLHAALTLVL